MKKISTQSKSFIVLFCLALVGVYTCLTLWTELFSQGYVMPYDYGQYKIPAPGNTAPAATASAQAVKVDTSLWKSYTDPKNHLTFKYSPDWKVLPAKTAKGFTVVQIDPGKKYYNIKIYISPKDFYIMGGLPAKTDSLGGQAALNVSDLLYGVQANGLYYTFDIGLSLSLKDQFNAMVHTVNFGI